MGVDELPAVVRLGFSAAEVSRPLDLVGAFCSNSRDTIELLPTHTNSVVLEESEDSKESNRSRKRGPKQAGSPYGTL